MGDTVTILPELPFRQQVIELATHISRSLQATAQDPLAAREYVSSVEQSLGGGGEAGATESGENVEVPEAKAKEVVLALVGKVGEARGALEGLKEADVESAHLLIQHVLSTNLSGAEYEQAVRNTVEAIKKGAEANVSAGRMARVEVAARILNNTYNSLPASSPLRAPVLLTLLQLLPRFTDLSVVLPLTISSLSSSVSSWSIPSTEKAAFLRSASDIYASAGQYGFASDILALPDALTADGNADRSVVLSVCDERRFEAPASLNVGGDGADAKLGSEAKGLVGVLKGSEGVQEWVAKNGSWIENRGIPKFTADLITRKSQLISLARLFASAPSRTLSFSSIASSLGGISEDEVDEYIFDGTSAGLFVARISQPTSTVRVVSVSKAVSASASGAGAEFEWDLLAKRLGEWKGAVAEARRVVGEAETFAAQPIREERYGNGRQGQGQGQQRQGQGQGQGQGQQDGKRREKGDGQQQQQQQQQQAEAVAAQ